MTTASADTLLRQSGMTAAEWLDAARRYIDETFGEGYAKKNPELVGVFMRCAADDFLTATQLKARQEA